MARIFFLGFLTCLLAAYFGYRVLGRICRPLESLSENAREIAKERPGETPAGGQQLR